MIVLGNSRLSTAMLLIGIEKSRNITSREEGLEALEDLGEEELIIANTSVVEKVPELKDYPNLVTLPDDPEKFGELDDLRDTVKSAVGMEIEV